MKQAVIVLSVLAAIALAIVYFDKKKKAAFIESERLLKIRKENVGLKEQESKIENRALRYWEMSDNEKYKLWKDIFIHCPKMKAAITQQMEKWGRDWGEQLNIEIDWYMSRKGRDPKDYISSCR
jgi:hypothetical protein